VENLQRERREFSYYLNKAVSVDIKDFYDRKNLLFLAESLAPHLTEMLNYERRRRLLRVHRQRAAL
jgi:hypothetical protein